jgi:hypothetical protein
MFIVMTIAYVWLAAVATRARKQKQAVDKVQISLESLIYL